MRVGGIVAAKLQTYKFYLKNISSNKYFHGFFRNSYVSQFC